jgi:hypothetical protein
LGFVLLAAAAAQAQYSVTITGGAVTIDFYTGSGGVVAIPTTISNLPVTSIGEQAFYGMTNVTGVTIPENVTSIGERAFAGAGLTSLTVLASVTNFGDYAFSDCSNLASVTIASAVIGEAAFYGCSGLTNLTMAEGVTNIGENAFALCSSLASVMIRRSVISIGEDAFAQCSSLASVTMASGVTSIGVGAFTDCASLTGITIPSTVTNIGLEAFLDCSSLSAFTVAPENSFYSSTNGVLFDKNQTTLIACPCAISGSYAIPGGVTSIETYAFFGCTGLTNVTIPGSVTNIEDDAFNICPTLTSVFFAGNPPVLGSGVFLSDNDVRVYYLPGTTGWSSSFYGLAAVLWNPLIQASGASFGVQGAQFGFNVTGTTNIPIVVEACTNLASPVWIPLRTLTLTKGLFYFSEPRQANIPTRYYRISSP